MHFRESRKEIENKMETKSRKMKFTDLKDMLNQTGEVYGDRPAYIFKTEEKGKFRTITHKEFRENINSLGTTLIQMGLKDKRIALISENRYEWELHTTMHHVVVDITRKEKDTVHCLINTILRTGQRE